MRYQIWKHVICMFVVGAERCKTMDFAIRNAQRMRHATAAHTPQKCYNVLQSQSELWVRSKPDLIHAHSNPIRP